ncbi:hypothetical protein BCV69DRAFT_279673 [Microstroma glucosiphilum]|uniref:uS12 prolyl 3,4-dihydroxylase n=1 Tax=Pseudomicrostroma glucosiphilum TaxID=1684307 RepID=A0A316UEX2_9BASI|nr:hypothetical protein BCV69DRAFT_279673 [Pseudomicrostroma glucosiphilum]PWN23750.1 hypothetical protein BCV69DRAFT_279673 [Pseudomicrostroma glucosiphilum]
MADVRAEIEERFAPKLLSKDSRASYQSKFASSQPYKHAVVDALISDELLRKAREEIVEELRFAEKETDIYKVNQTGDLANLDGLPETEAERLKYLLKVRDAIYSPEFRQWLQDVTGCGPLSAKKKDMSINDYRQGCHLLNHDDVIATRRVSYILYLPDPAQPWQPQWGGALELYPVKPSEGEGHARQPENIPSVVIPPKWNQYTFFTVQPGHSFHSVEEVAHPTASRLSISGWFHRPQPDEEGFDPADEEREEKERKDHASAEGLSSKKFAASYTSYPEDAEPPLPGSQMTQADVNFLRPFLNPAYLSPKTQGQLFEQFGDESHILLSDVFNSKVAAALEKGLKSMDDKDGFRWWKKGKGEEGIVIPAQETGVDSDWSIVGPPHRQRFLSLRASKPADAALASNPSIPATLPLDSPAELLDIIRTSVLPSSAFRHFLANITQLVPISHRPFEARRFRPGLDYSLARADEEAVLDVCFGLTPDVGRIALDAAGGTGGPKGLAGKGSKAKKSAKAGPSQLTKKQAKEIAGKWESGEIGGWSCYMAPDEEDVDATGEVYRQAGGSKSKAQAETEAAAAIIAEDEGKVVTTNGEGSSKPSLQRKNVKEFDQQYVVLGISAPQSSSAPSDKELHDAISQALLTLHGNVGGSFHFDVLSIKPSTSDSTSSEKQEWEALLRVASEHLQALLSALAASLTISSTVSYRTSVLQSGPSYSISNGGSSGSKWLNELSEPSGKGMDEDEEEVVNGDVAEEADGAAEKDEDAEEDEEMEDEDFEDEEDEDFDGVLLNLTPSFNTLSVALRDEGVLHFVKYLSAAAGGSRWDIIGEWAVGAVEADEDDAEMAS